MLQLGYETDKYWYIPLSFQAPSIWYEAVAWPHIKPSGNFSYKNGSSLTCWAIPPPIHRRVQTRQSLKAIVAKTSQWWLKVNLDAPGFISNTSAWYCLISLMWYAVYACGDMPYYTFIDWYQSPDLKYKPAILSKILKMSLILWRIYLSDHQVNYQNDERQCHDFWVVNLTLCMYDVGQNVDVQKYFVQQGKS